MSIRMVLVVVVGLLVAACGPSSGQIKEARNARYDTQWSTVFDAGIATLKSNGFQIATADAAGGKATTFERHFDVNGGAVPDGTTPNSTMILLVVHLKLIQEDGRFRVELTPIAREKLRDFAAPNHLDPNEPPMSTWVAAKIDNLYVTLHDSLAAHVAKPPTTMP